MMSKLQFFEMRAEEISGMYDSTFTKKEAVKTGAELAKKVLEDGEILPLEFMANLSRLKWVIDSVEGEMRSSLEVLTKETVLGIEFNPVLGGNTVNFKEDEIWLDIKSQLAERESLLKVALASKKEVYDEDGIMVPKVSTTPKKSSITIK
jgi:hypothetical protein